MLEEGRVSVSPKEFLQFKKINKIKCVCLCYLSPWIGSSCARRAGTRVDVLPGAGGAFPR
jgi:hypothetical protein